MRIRNRLGKDDHDPADVRPAPGEHHARPLSNGDAHGQFGRKWRDRGRGMIGPRRGLDSIDRCFVLPPYNPSEVLTLQQAAVQARLK
jgi:hypothetical protein